MTGTEEVRDYSAFGLKIRSGIALPELEAREFADGADVSIRAGAMPAGAPERNGAHHYGGGTMLVVEGIGRYHIVGGREIVVEPAAGVASRNLRLYLLGSAMGLLLHQRGLLPLHANAIEIDGNAVAFMGPSGEGKSTLAAWFHDRGQRIIADDVCVVCFDDHGRPRAAPGLPRLRLWREILESTGRDPAHFARSYAGCDEWEKYDVPLAREKVASAPTELAGIYLLERGESLVIEKLSGVAAADALFANTYRGAEVPRSGKPRLHWEACLRLIECVPLFLLRRAWGFELLDEQGEAILTHARETIRVGRTSPRSS